jgi:hypothetical protein
MKPHFYPFKVKDWLTLAGVIVIGFGWLLIDQKILSEVYQRFIALFILLLGLFSLQFFVNKPTDTIRYANTLALTSVSFIVAVSIIMHVIIKHDFTFKSVSIWIIAGVIPYMSGFIYSLSRKKN